MKENNNGPTVVFFGGIHGNEPAGIFALEEVMRQLQESNTVVSGSIFALAGNLRALNKGKRYEQKDLNRIWSIEKVEQLKKHLTNHQPTLIELDYSSLLQRN